MSHVKQKVEEDIVYASASLPAVFFKIHLPLCYSFPVTDIESKNGSITGNEWGGSPRRGVGVHMAQNAQDLHTASHPNQATILRPPAQ
jgi:hypothetical protein